MEHQPSTIQSHHPDFDHRVVAFPPRSTPDVPAGFPVTSATYPQSAPQARVRTRAIGQLAVLEVENVMEHMAVLPWSVLKAGMAAPQLSPSARNNLPGAELKVEVTNPAAEPGAKQIVVSLRWQDRAGQFVSPIKIATWRWKR